MRVFRRFTVVVAIATLIGFAPNVAASSARSGIEARLLALTDLPTGWSVDNTPSTGGKLTDTRCLSGFKTTPKHGAKATVQYAFGGNIPVLEELLAQGPAQAARYRAFNRALASCKSFNVPTSNGTINGTVGAMSFPRIGLSSSAYAITATIEHVNVGYDLVLFRSGPYVGLLGYGDLGTPDINQVEAFARQAAAKAAGRPVASSAQHSSTTEPSRVPTQSSFLAGNAHPQFPAGPAGQVSVVYQAPISPQQNGTSVPIALDNDSSKAVAHVDISGTAKDATGKIVGSGSSQGTSPSVIEPGQWALAYIYFQSADGLSSSDTMSFGVNTMPVDTSPYNTAAIQVTQANPTGTTITGGVQNTTGHVVVGPTRVDAYCFDGAGHPVYTQGTSTASSGDLAPNATDSYQINFYNQQCPSFLVGASSYYK